MTDKIIERLVTALSEASLDDKVCTLSGREARDLYEHIKYLQLAIQEERALSHSRWTEVERLKEMLKVRGL